MNEAIPEFSRPVALEALRGGLVRRSIEASAEECRALATRLGLTAVETLAASVTLEARAGGKIVVVRGTLQAALTQTCVVTLEPLPRTVSETFTERLAVAAEASEGAVVDIDPEAEDEPEPVEGDSVDIGELVVQHLALALDPYPRAEGASVDAGAMSAGEVADDGPFAELARLKPKA